MQQSIRVCVCEETLRCRISSFSSTTIRSRALVQTKHSVNTGKKIDSRKFDCNLLLSFQTVGNVKYVANTRTKLIRSDASVRCQTTPVVAGIRRHDGETRNAFNPHPVKVTVAIHDSSTQKKIYRTKSISHNFVSVKTFIYFVN